MAELNIPTHRYYKTENNVRLKKLDKSKMWFLDGAPIITIVGPPTIYTTPAIQGGNYPGDVLFCSNGVWGGEATITFTYQWTKDGVDIPGATSALYTILVSEVASLLNCKVTGTNGQGSATEFAQPARLVLQEVANTVLPAISGTPAVGETLTASTGTWDGYPAPTYTYQWNRNGVPIPLALNSTYIVTSADAEATLTVTVTAKNYHSTAAATSAGLSIIIDAPLGGSGIVISGDPQVGNTLTVNNGSWTGEYITFTYQWTVDGVAVPGQVFNYYNILPEDDGKDVFATVFATNPAGSNSNVSNTVTVQSAPFNTSLPVLTGDAEVGQTLSVSTGTWTGTPTITYTYQWKQNGADIVGQTANTLLVDAAYLGNTITCEVTATNNAGVTSVTTSGAVAYTIPVIAAFTISGTPWVGLPLTFSMPVITGTPTPVATIFWEADGSFIPGATGTTYILESEYQGKDIVAVVSATNIGGTVEQRSNAITAFWLPYNIVEPFLAKQSKSEIGGRLHANPGTWGGTEPVTITYQWYRDGVQIAGETDKRYQLVADDAGSVIYCRVTATNPGASTFADTNSIVADYQPANIVAPIISGNLFPGSVLSCDTGVWDGVTNTYFFQWRRNGANIAGATSSTYTIQTVDVGQQITCLVTVINAVGQNSALSNILVPVNVTPANTVPPTISGNTLVGSMLTTTDGTWTDATTFTYEWLRNGVPISGAVASVYATRVEDIGQTITSRVSAGAVSAVSSNNIVVTPATNLTQPVISGATIVGSVLTTDNGDWDGSGVFTYEWLRDGSPIAGASASTYTTVEADIGATITSRVSIGPTSAVSSNNIVVTSPVNLVQPTISGNAIVGYTLTTTNGTWQNPVSFTYEWLRDGSPIAGATASTYSTVAADIGTTITSRVTTGGASAVSSNSIAVTAPVNLVQPVVAGNTAVGSLLTTTNGTWDGLTSFTYEWLRDGTPIGGAVSDVYTTVAADAGTTITSRVTNLGVQAVSSNSIAVPLPVNTVAPVIAGDITIGSTLTTDDGTWDDAGPFTYEWLRDDTPIPGETANSYLTTNDDSAAVMKSRVSTYGVAAVSSNSITMESVGSPWNIGWPYAADPLWDNVICMVDLTATAFYPNGTYGLTNRVDNVQAAQTWTVSGQAISNGGPGANLFLNDNMPNASKRTSGAPFTVEFLYSGPAGANGIPMVVGHIGYLNHAGTQVVYPFAPGVNAYVDGAYQGSGFARTAPWWASGYQHYCFQYNGVAGGEVRTYINGALQAAKRVLTGSKIIPVGDTQPIMYINAAGQWRKWRFTTEVLRYPWGGGFTPDTNFGTDYVP